MTTQTEIYVGNACAAVTVETDATGADVTIDAGVVRATFRIPARELRRCARMLNDAVESVEATLAAKAEG